MLIGTIDVRTAYGEPSFLSYFNSEVKFVRVSQQQTLCRYGLRIISPPTS